MKISVIIYLNYKMTEHLDMKDFSGFSSSLFLILKSYKPLLRLTVTREKSGRYPSKDESEQNQKKNERWKIVLDSAYRVLWHE